MGKSTTKTEAAPAPVLSMYQITEGFLELQNLLMQTGGVLDEESEQRMDELTALRDDKGNGYYRVIQNFKRTAEVYKLEIDRLTKAMQAAKNGAGRVLARLEEQMKIQEINELQCDIGKFSLVASGGGSLILKDNVKVSDLPDEFIKIPDPTAMKKELKTALKNGDERLNSLVEILPPVPSIRMY